MAATNNPSSDSDLLAVGRAAAVTGISERTLRYWITTGKLTATAGSRGRRVRLSEVQRLAQITGRQSAILKDTADLATDSTGNTAEVLGTAHDRMLARDESYRQLETLRDTLLKPLIEQNERMVDRIAELEREAGRLESERDAERRRADELQAAVERLIATQTAETTAAEAEAVDEISATPGQATRPWWRFWGGS